MKKIVPAFYKEFGMYKVKNQMVNNHFDGCIPVWRRFLLSTHEIARNNFVKSANIVGYNMYHYHPHGDSVGPMMALVHNNFIKGQGYWGNNSGIDTDKCAHQRYTEAKAHPFIEELAFKYVDYVEWKRDECDPEPVYLPTPIPFSLFCVYSKDVMVFGFKTHTPNFKISDMLKRQLYLITNDKKYKDTPFPNILNCEILTPKKEMEKYLKESQFTIEGKGIIEKDPSNFRIYIRGWDPLKDFKTVYNFIDKKTNLVSNQDIIEVDESDSSGTCIKLEVSRNRNRIAFYEKMESAVEEAVKFKMAYNLYTYNPISDELLRPSVDELLLNSFQSYKEAFSNYLIKSIEKYEILLEEINVIEKIRPHIGDVIKIKDTDKLIKKLSELSGVNEDIIKIVTEKYKIKSLLTTKYDKDMIKEKLDELKNKLENIEQETINNLIELLKESKKYEESIEIY